MAEEKRAKNDIFKNQTMISICLYKEKLKFILDFLDKREEATIKRAFGFVL